MKATPHHITHKKKKSTSIDRSTFPCVVSAGPPSSGCVLMVSRAPARAPQLTPRNGASAHVNACAQPRMELLAVPGARAAPARETATSDGRGADANWPRVRAFTNPVRVKPQRAGCAPARARARASVGRAPTAPSSFYGDWSAAKREARLRGTQGEAHPGGRKENAEG